jgi:hypothetical protein
MLRLAQLLHIERMGGLSLGAVAGLYRCSLNTEICEADYLIGTNFGQSFPPLSITS